MQLIPPGCLWTLPQIPVMTDPLVGSPTPGAPGFNKQLRDQARYALALTAILLVSNRFHWACISSAYAIYNLKAGTALSSKNAKWMLLSVASFCVGLSCTVLQGGARLVDEERDYSFRSRLQFWCFALKTFWWPTLTLFLICTWGHAVDHDPSQTNLSTATKKIS